MNSASNSDLYVLYKHWEWEADWMTCRGCNRHLIASRDGEPFVHGEACKVAELHPWKAMRDILNQPSQTGEKHGE